jgi:crossover junction endodeoxyribonuclease RusA
MSRWDNLRTGLTARLPGDYAPVTDAEIRRKSQYEPGGVAPAAMVMPAVQVPPRSSCATLGAEISLTLPWPPSINHYWRRAGKVIHVSTEGTRFGRRVGIAVRGQFRSAPIDQPVAVLVEAWGPRASWGDVDNRVKPLLDALTKAELWTDDRLVRDVRIVDRGQCAGGKVVVSIRPFRR